MLRRSFLAALGLAPAALIPAPKPAEHDGPLIRGITFEGKIANYATGVRIENCTCVDSEANGFKIVGPA